MKPQAILYTSYTGYTRQYAILLGEKTGLPVYSLKEGTKELPAGCAVIYLGWIMAGTVKGYAEAAKRLTVTAVCGVGMGATGSQEQDLRKANALPPSLPVFTLQGGFDRKRLRGVYRLMMTVMAKTVGKKLSEKKDRTPEEDEMLELLLRGGNRVSEEHLDAVLAWYHA